MSRRLWEREAPGERKPATRRDYETAGYVIEGKAELTLEGQTIYLEPFTAVEATAPPAQAHGRDEGRVRGSGA